MFAPRIRPATRLQQRPLARSASSSSSSSGGGSVPPPRPSYFSRQTLYPFLLLSTITSLALNLSHSRSQRQQETSQLSAQITVLEAVVARLQQASWSQLTEEDRETVERELELVGLGRGKAKAKLEHDETEETSWGEVLFGKKGKEYEPEKDDTDWEKGELCLPVYRAVTSLTPPFPQSSRTPTPPRSPSRPLGLPPHQKRSYQHHPILHPLHQYQHPPPNPPPSLDQLRRRVESTCKRLRPYYHPTALYSKAQDAFEKFKEHLRIPSSVGEASATASTTSRLEDEGVSALEGAG